jgi:hypothetical protein
MKIIPSVILKKDSNIIKILAQSLSESGHVKVDFFYF